MISWTQFLEFEKKHNLFELQDSKQTFYWDILRYEIYSKLLWRQNTYAPTQQIKRGSFFKKIKRFGQFIKLYFDSSPATTLFYLASRNKTEEGIFIDQNAQTVYQHLSKIQKTFVIESYDTNQNNYALAPQLIYRKFHKTVFFDFSNLLNTLEKEFGTLNFDQNLLNTILNGYYSDITFFERILKNKKVKQVFVTQNGIQKGLFKAAKNLNIKTFEFQHGIVDVGHMAYSYPKINYKENSVSLPDFILSLSPFWFNDLFIPNVKIHCIGNDYFYNPLNQCNESNENTNNILVISSKNIGMFLVDFIVNLASNKDLTSITIYFKLHSNQFSEKMYFEEKLKSFKNIRIITTEYSIGDLFSQCSTVFTVLSTTVYEALQAKLKVIVLKKGPYEILENIFNQPNLHLIDTIDDFMEAFQARIDKEKAPVFFTPFDKEAFLKLV